MKKHFILSAAIVLAASFILISCKKDEENNNNGGGGTPEPTATITISEPVTDSTYEYGEEVGVDIEIMADFDMHGYEVYMINLTADDTVWSSTDHDHSEGYIISGLWTNTVTEHSDMLLKVTATIDHDGATATDEVAFHCHPM